MSTHEHGNADGDQLSIRVGRYQHKLDELTDKGNLAEFLYLNRNLSREEYDAKVIELGYRAMLKTLVSLGCAGDTKALDLALKRCDLHFSKVRSAPVEDSAQPAPYVKPNRDGTPKG